MASNNNIIQNKPFDNASLIPLAHLFSMPATNNAAKVRHFSESAKKFHIFLQKTYISVH